MLSKRLQHIYNMTPKCETVADIGTDHGYLPIALVATKHVKKAYAMDINKGPLDKCTLNIEEAGLRDKVLTLQSDGLEKLPEDVDVVVIAGMGGMLMARILKDEADKLRQLDAMVLSPHQDEEAVRRQLNELGWIIKKERMVEDNEKFYTVMLCQPGEEVCEALEIKYGKHLVSGEDTVWVKYMFKKKNKLEEVKERLLKQDSEGAKARLAEVTEELKEIEEVLGNAD